MSVLRTAVVVGVVLVLAGCSGDEPAMPDVTGKKLDDAQAAIEGAGFDEDVKVDGGGMFGVIVEGNWMVCEQTPPAGEALTAPPQLAVDRQCGQGEESTAEAEPTKEAEPTEEAEPTRRGRAHRGGVRAGSHHGEQQHGLRVQVRRRERLRTRPHREKDPEPDRHRDEFTFTATVEEYVGPQCLFYLDPVTTETR